MKYVPHEYQKYAAEYICNHPVCAVFLDMGLGKTIQAIGTAVLLKKYGFVDDV